MSKRQPLYQLARQVSGVANDYKIDRDLPDDLRRYIVTELDAAIVDIAHANQAILTWENNKPNKEQ